MGEKERNPLAYIFFIPVLLHFLQSRHHILWRKLAKTFDDLVRQKSTSVWPSSQLLTMYTTFNTTLIVFYSICNGRGNFQEVRRFEDGWSVEGTSNCHCGSYIGDKAFVLYLIFTTAKTNCRPRGVRVRPTSFCRYKRHKCNSRQPWTIVGSQQWINCNQWRPVFAGETHSWLHDIQSLEGAKCDCVDL